jgi:hypothetical protein
MKKEFATICGCRLGSGRVRDRRIDDTGAGSEQHVTEWLSRFAVLG